MSIYSTIINRTYHDSKHLSKEDIDKKKDYSYISCWGDVKFNKGTNIHRFWKFYQLAFPPAYQANLIIWQAFIQLVSTLTKVTSTSEDEDLAKRLSLKLVESIRYHYLSDKSVVVITWIIWEVIVEIIGFTKGNTSHMVLVNIKKKEEKDWVTTSIFESFLEKLGKDKGYVLVEDLT